MVQCPPRMASGRRQCRQERCGNRCLPHAGPHTNVEPPLALAGLAASHDRQHPQRSGGAHAGAPPPANPVATRDRRAATAGATTTQGVQIELANLWQTASSGSRGGDRSGVTPRPELLVWSGAPAGIEPGDPILTMNLALTAVRTSVSAGR